MERLSIALDATDENTRGRLRIWHVPAWRRAFASVAALVTVPGVYGAVVFASSGTAAIVGAATVVIAAPLLVWYLFAYRYSAAFSVAGATHIASGSSKRFTYEITDSAVVEHSEYGERSYPLESLLGVDRKLGYYLLRFKGGLIYLPTHAGSTSEIGQFVEAVESQARPEIQRNSDSAH